MSLCLLTALLTARKIGLGLTCTKHCLILQHGHQRIRFSLYFGKQVIPAAASLPPPTTLSSPQYSHIKETSSKTEKLNKAVKRHFYNYVQQLQRNTNFFVSVDWVKAKRFTYSLLLSSYFIFCCVTWKPWENKPLEILLWMLKPK